MSWARDVAGAGLQLNVTLPSGSGGAVSVPKSYGASTVCSESGVSIWANGAFVPGVPGVLSALDDGDFVTFSVTSGAFIFTTST